jgi:hypothetical protein
LQWPLPGPEPPPTPFTVPAYATIQHLLPPAYAPPPIEEEPSLDTMARQTAAGYLAAGPLLNGITGGGAEGIDLLPQARRVLHAQKVLLRIREPGPLVSTQPPGLATVASYAPLLYGGGASAEGVTLPLPVSQPPPLYTTAQASIGGFRGGGVSGTGPGASG